MDSHGFDRLARLLARLPASPAAASVPRSRRQVLRGVAVGIVSTAAFARTPERVAAALCPNRVPVPGYRPTVNGCGPSGFGWVIPDSWNRANFTPACNQHDRCYGTCNSNRGVCDNQMRAQMKRACNRAYGRRGHENLWRLRCLKRVNLYYNVVNRRGQSAYEDAQNEACFCCSPGQIACRSACCNPNWCEVCSGGQCVSTCPPCHYCNGSGACLDCGVGCCGG